MSIQNLAKAWILAKEDEDAAIARRLDIEEQLAQALQFPEDGSKTHKVEGYKITVTGRLNFRADMPHLLSLAGQLPDNLRPIKTEPTLDRTGVKWLRSNEPEIYRIIAPAIEVVPGKPGFKIEPLTN